MARTGTRLLITDLDNTLWDWLGSWYASFSSLMDSLHEESGVDLEVLLDEARDVHRARHTTEYSNLLNEMPSLKSLCSGSDTPMKTFDNSLHAQYAARKRATKLYPTVFDTLTALKEQEVKVVAYTESGAYWTTRRMLQTGLDGVVDVLYSAPDHDRLGGVDLQALRFFPHEDPYSFKFTESRELDLRVRKPNARVLRQILEEQGCRPTEAIYVGDNLMKDVAMAQETGVLDVHAAYGESHDRSEYELLKRVTYWTEEEVSEESRIAQGRHVVPSFALECSFSEVAALFCADHGR